MKIARRVMAGAIICLLSGLLALEPAAAQRRDQSDEWRIDGFLGFEAQGDTDLERSGAGDFDFWMPYLGVRGTKRGRGSNVTVSIGGDYRIIGYDFDLGPAFAGTGIEGWDDVHVVRINPTLTLHLSDRWSLVGGPIFEIARESDADFGDSLRGGGSLAVGYRAGPFSVAVGALVQSEIEDDVYAQPILLVDWAVVGSLRLQANATTSRGGDLRLGYTFLRDWTVSLGYGYRRERFRLDDDGPPPLEDGVGQEEAQTFRGALRYGVGDGIGVEAYIGTTIDGDFRVETETGNKIVSSDYDDAVFGGLQFTFGF